MFKLVVEHGVLSAPPLKFPRPFHFEPCTSQEAKEILHSGILGIIKIKIIQMNRFVKLEKYLFDL